jgi:hypothetical protein
MLPNLVVIGAAKCATTSLHEYLDTHPEIAMSRPKELDFFVPEKSRGRSLEWYERQFRDAPVRGETSPSYTVHPFRPGVPERMHAVIPGARLIYLVRDPIDRIVSHYRHRVVNHPHIGSFEDALSDPQHGPELTAYSRYWHQLEQYLEFFPVEQILVVDTDELSARREGTMERIFRFLGVDTGHRAPEIDRWHNPGSTHGRLTTSGQVLLRALNVALGRRHALGVRQLAPAWARSRFRLPYERPVPSAELRHRLEEELRPDVEQLRQHTGLPLAGWSL